MKFTKTVSGKYTTLLAVSDRDGKRHYVRFTKKTKRECEAAALEYLARHQYYENSKVFSDALTRLLDRKRDILSPSTMAAYDSYARTLSQYERFMKKDINMLARKDFQSLADDLRQTRKRKTVSNIMGLISDVLTAEGYTLPPIEIRKDREKFTPNVPDPDEVQAVAAAAKGTKWELPFALACMGLRRGEICAASSSDLSGDVLHVRHSLVQASDGSTRIKGTKTDSSDRFVPLPASVADLLRSSGRAWSATPKAMSDGFPHLIRSAGVEPFRLHDCRHFFASYCHDILKLSDAQIMKLGGWQTDHVMKRVYITAVSDESAAARDAFGKLLG